MAKTKTHTFDYDLIVIGSGASGSAAATAAANDGKKVAIVEADTFGGDSPNWSDIPIKALLHAANLYDEARHGAKFGLRSSTLGYNYPSIRAWKDLAVKRTGAGGNRRYYENRNISTFVGLAHFLSPNEISVNRRHLSAKNFIIATGSSWSIPEIPGTNDVQCLTPRNILESIRPPKSLLIVGGNDTAIEIAQLMSVFGTKVYIVEKAERLLPRYDQEVGAIIERILCEQKGATCLTHSKLLSIEKDGLGKKVLISRAGTEKSFRVDEIVFTTDLMPNVDMGLENAGVKYTGAGIKVDNFLQTSAKHVYAVGNVLGKYNNAHTAFMEGQVAANNISRSRIEPDYTATPEVVFVNPNIATVGLSEDDCLKRDLSINKAIAPLNMIARSNTADFRDGFVKIVTDKKGVILGASVVAPHAAEIIHELALAVRHNLTVSDVASTPHAFLSWSEAVRIAASKLV